MQPISHDTEDYADIIEAPSQNHLLHKKLITFISLMAMKRQLAAIRFTLNERCVLI